MVSGTIPAYPVEGASMEMAENNVTGLLRAALAGEPIGRVIARAYLAGYERGVVDADSSCSEVASSDRESSDGAS